MRDKKPVNLKNDLTNWSGILRHLILTFLFVAAGLWGGGCSSGVHVSKEEIPHFPDEKYLDVVRPSTIVGIVMPPEEGVVDDTLVVITFDTLGAEVDLNSSEVSGISTDGSSVTKNFDDLLYLQVKAVDLAKQLVTPLELSCSREDAENNPRKRIKRGASPCWDVIEFNEEGGRYDSKSQSLVGVTKQGTQVAIKTDDVLYARVFGSNKLRLVRWGVLGLGVAVFTNGAAHLWDFY